MRRYTGPKCCDITCHPKKKATQLILDCEAGSPVCDEHAKREHRLGNDNTPFRVIPIFKGWVSRGWVDDQLKKLRKKARRTR